MKPLPKFTFGMGDRFAHQGEAQLSAVKAAADRGIPLHPVWNKSNREHMLIGTKPADLRAEADAAVKALGWSAPYFVDADHINLYRRPQGPPGDRRTTGAQQPAPQTYRAAVLLRGPVIITALMTSSTPPSLFQHPCCFLPYSRLDFLLKPDLSSPCMDRAFSPRI